ncbi:MAG TPA: filamentous hemagglutinin N-terminal domain-containing protein [Ideonella sp.]|uniref:filamentous hemagglutinin N-terminal domain-containing protein n=1 Tax=Ideonella sp. TaxID=1929293 RepID=UPI002CEDC5F3|nr:filamentous hemagglutinin N-terminal domain-containing protein [Ideonella sp.]HSI46755.1 filamentous hemagglutinin N-terminal domain-containing protein [Ideonella sp.]
MTHRTLTPRAPAARARFARDLLFVRLPRRVRRALRWHLNRGHGVAFTQLALLAGAAASPGLALANPTGAQVVAGNVQIVSSVPATLDIQQSSSKAIINWDSFNIGAGETVNFIQPSLKSVTLNRVLGNDPSAIFGQLNATGTVMLVNPNGIVFGAGSRVDVGGLVATTSNISDRDFLAGRFNFNTPSPLATGGIVNAGQISIKDSGLAALVAPSVQNSGVIQARLGRIALAGAERFTLDFQGDGLLSFSAGSAVTQHPVDANGQPVAALVSNTGVIRADGGSVLLAANAVQGVIDNVINTSGVIAATTVGSQGGRIVLSGGQGGGEHGGVVVGGSVSATGQTGGHVTVTGEAVRVVAGAVLDVSGQAGGGEIALGSRGRASGYAGKSNTTTVEAGASLKADALARGDGGSITAWSADTTVFDGGISARGGEAGGNGGFAEISSQKNIGLTGHVDLRATHGATGNLLLDPTDLRITDTASGGSQDGNATDATVAAGDANQGSGNTLNTVSRGLLESLSGSSNITLQATGQITVDAMANHLINFATTAGHSVSLQSTQNGGIQFIDPSTELRTQGGSITLEAFGIGSTLSNIGKLTSNGGAITLNATGDVQLAGAINAGSGAVTVQSTVGSIRNAASSTPLLSGSAVTLSAAGGAIGASGNAINTHTGNLTLASGGDIVAGSDTQLASLSLTANHVAPGAANAYQVSAPNLLLQMTDGASLGVTQVSQSAGLNLGLASDRSLQLGTLNVGAGTLDLRSTGGNLTGTAGTALTAGSVTLTAQGSNGNNGAVGTSGQAINTSTGHLVASAGSGGAFVANTGALALDRLDATGSSAISATGTLSAGSVNAGTATLALTSSGGSLLDDGNATTRIAAGTLQLSAGGAIGSAGTRLQTNASTLSATAASGGIYAATSATSSVLSSISSGNGAIDITVGGSSTLSSLSSGTSSASNDITVTATGTGSMSIGTVNAGSLGDVNLATQSGSILGSSGTITGNTVTLNAANSGSVSVRTAASHLDVQAGSSSISITQTGAVTLDRIATPSSLVSVTNSSGDITVGNVSTSASGQVSLTASAGAILDDGNSATRISTGTATLSASGSIGSASHALQTSATGLAATSTGDLYVDNANKTLTSLSVTNRHTTPGSVNTLQISSDYLTFDVTDNGSQYTLNRLVGAPLSSLAFSGDQGAVIGQVQGAGSVSLTATQGNLVDDGNAKSRITAGSTLSLSATAGNVGSSLHPMGANAGSLVLTTRGDLYVSDIADLSSLTIASSHPDASTSYGMAITAPSLKLAVTDSAAGHLVSTLTDNSSLSLSFTSDRDITLGTVNLTNTGTARFTSTGGAIKDDGDKSTRVLANSTTLAGSAVGASGSDHMDVVTGTLAASATAGGVYVEVPMPTGSTNTTSTLTLGTITATGPVVINALEGDVSLGGYLTATNQAVSLTSAQGGIYSPSGYSIGFGTGSLTLNAAKGIGTSSAPLMLTSTAGSTLNASAGSDVFLRDSGALLLASVATSSGGITHTQTSGDVSLGTLSAPGAIAVTASSGSVLDDANTGTGLSGSQVTLAAAAGSVGSSSAALNVATPKLLVTAKADVAVNDSTTLDTLSLTRSASSAGTISIGTAAGQSVLITEDAGSHDLQQVSSSTPLAFSFSGQRSVKVGQLDLGAAGSATLTSTTDIGNDAVYGSYIAAGTVGLTAGSAYSIGTSTSAIALQGTTVLNASAGRNVYIADDSTLTDLNLISTNTTTAAGTASVFDITAAGQTFGITDSGTTQSLDFSGTALASTSFSTRKNIEVGAITATGDVTLATSGGGANSNISSNSGSGTIAGNRVLLTATSSTAGGGSIGSSGTALRVDSPTVILNGSANVYLDDAQNLTKLDMTLTHGTAATFGYDVTAGNLNSFAVTDGNTQSLGMAVSGAMDFSYSVDRALSVATIDAGTSTTGSISLTSRSAPTGTNAQINRSSGSLTGGTITLSATGYNGGVGAGATLSTSTKNLSIASGGNVSVSNSTTLTSLNLDARHNTSGSSTHSYAISSTGLTFSISDTTGNNAFQLTNIAQSGLDLALKADRVITASSVNTGSGGKVTLNSSSYVQGGSGASAGSPSITTGDLSLNGGSAFGYQGSTPLYTAASTLASSLSSTLYLSNNGSLSLLANTVGSSADVATTSGSLLQGSGGLFSTPTLKLSANQSIGASGTLLTDVRRLTLVARGNIDVANASDLYALAMTSTHATPGVQNTIAVTAPRLTLNLSDNGSGNQYHLANLLDSSGLDFTLSTDVALSLGSVNAQAGRALGLYSTGSTTAITNDGSSLLTASSITLSAGGSVGAAGGSGTRMQTDALGLAIITGANAFADNAQDLSSLSLTSSQTAGGTAPVYQVTAPSLSFDISDNGITHLNNLADSTGLNFALNTRRDQAVDVVDVTASGTVSLTSSGDILGDADSSHRITAGSAAFYASNGGAIGSVGNPIHLTAPLVSLSPTGALNIESDTHIDRLAISTTHPVGYGGSYSIVSTPITGAAYQLFSATDSVTGTALTSLDDTLGLAFSFTSDRAMQVGNLDLGSTGTVALTGTGSGGILGDGDPNTQVQAASLSMVSYGGAVGATGSGNAIDATVNSVSATAQGGGVNLALHGRTTLGSISSTGGFNLANDVGDIALGSINAGGNAVSINNQGGSILSGSIYNTTSVALTASGSIGSTSAVGLSANGGGTTTLTASASAAHGASGSIAISESYNLAASSVTAPAAVTLSSGYTLSLGNVTSGGAVTMSSSQGSITGINGSNTITGTSVDLSARYGTGNGIGSSGTRLNLNTPQLTLNTPGSIYVTDAADLSTLVIDRTNYTGTGSSGTLSVIASGLSFSASDSGNLTTLNTLNDSTGVDFSYLGIGSLSIGSLNAGSGAVLLQAYLSSGDGNIDAINGSSLITAGNLTLQSYGSSSHIGSSGSTLGLAVGSVTASSGTGGLFLRQAGSLSLGSLSTSGDLAVTASSGDLTLGSLSYGSNKTLSLTASAGSILAGSATLAGGSSSAAITLSAANGIGTELAPVLVNGSAGNAISASVTGTGSLYLSSTGTLNGGLTTAVHNGATQVTAAGNIKLSAMSSDTDALGNDITVTASAGDITVGSVSGGSNARFNAVDLSANAGKIIATSGVLVEGFDVSLHGATGVGDSSNRMAASGQRVQVSSGGGAIYLNAAAPSVLSSVDSNGGAINITSSADLLLANARSSGGAISVTTSTAGTELILGNVNAGSGAVTVSATGAGSSVQDDGNRNTRVAGGSVSLTGTAGVGSAAQSLQTTAGTLSASSANGIYIDDDNASGVTLSSIVASNGAVALTTTGPTTATLVAAQSDASGNDVSISTSSGDLTLVNVSAGANHGTVSLSSAGSILASGSGTQVSGHSASLLAGGDVGAVSNLATGAGSPVKLDVGSLSALGTTGSNRVVSVSNLGTGTLSLGGSALSLGSGSSAYVATAGDLDASAGIQLSGGNLALTAGGTLVLPTSAITTTGAVRLSGTTDVITSGNGRNLQVNANSLVLRSGSAGGSTQLTTAVGSLDAQLTGTGALTVNNTGTLASTTLATANGDISASSSNGLSASSVVAGGASRTVSLTAGNGDLTVATVNAGSNGTINLTASHGALTGGAATLTSHALNLASASGIGSAGQTFGTSAALVSAQVSGTGDIWLAPTAAVTLGQLSTADGSISVAGSGNITSATGLSAGNGGSLSLTSTGGDVSVAHAITQAGNVTLQGQHISVQGVSSSGAQSYTGATTLNGDLSGSAIALHGGTTLAGNRSLLAGNGALVLDGTLTAGGFAAHLQGSSVSLGGDLANLASLSVSGATTLSADTSIATNNGAVSFAGSLDGAHALTVDAGTGLTTLASVGGNTALSSLTVNGAAQLGGNVSTSGAQHYAGAVTLASDSTLSGQGVAFDSSVNGTQALTVNAGSGDASFAGAVGQTTGLGALTVNSSGATTFASSVQAASLSTDAAGTLALNGGAVSTTGAQSYGERAVLGADTTLTGSSINLAAGADGAHQLSIAGDAVLGTLGAQQALAGLAVSGATTLAADTRITTDNGTVSFAGSVDGAHALSISTGSGAITLAGPVGQTTRLGALQLDSSGATTLGGAVQAASVSTDAAGTLALNGGSVNTTGTQSWGERAVLGADTTLTGSSVSLAAGADGAHQLNIVGDASLGTLGAQQALAGLAVSGSSALGGDVTTLGDQQYAGAVQLAGDTVLHSSAGGLTLGSTVDSASHANLTLASDAGAIALGGAVGASSVLGALTVHAGTTLDFSGNVHADQVSVNTGGLTRFLGTLTADGAGGLNLSSGSLSFAQAVTATSGAIALVNTDSAGTANFASQANVQAATGFTQTGGAGIVLPASVRVAKGPITLAAPASLPSGEALIETEGTITISGLSGPATHLTLAAGHGPVAGSGLPYSSTAGALLIGLADGNSAHQIDVASLTVTDATSASLFGRINGKGGAVVASMIDSALVNAPFFVNGTPWGPVEVINRLVATTVPVSVVPSTPGANALFTQVVTSAGLAPNALGVYAAPQVLTLSAALSPNLLPGLPGNSGAENGSGNTDEEKKKP